MSDCERGGRSTAQFPNFGQVGMNGLEKELQFEVANRSFGRVHGSFWPPKFVYRHQIVALARSLLEMEHMTWRQASLRS